MGRAVVGSYSVADGGDHFSLGLLGDCIVVRACSGIVEELLFVGERFSFLVPDIGFFNPNIVTGVNSHTGVLGVRGPLIIARRDLRGVRGNPIIRAVRSLGGTNISCTVFGNIRPGPGVHGVGTNGGVCRRRGYSSVVAINKNSTRSYNGKVNVVLAGNSSVAGLTKVRALSGPLPPLVTIGAATKANSRLAQRTIVAGRRSRLGFIIIS